MLQKIIHFIKYNNATIIILAIILVLGGGALAAGPDAIGGKQTSVQGVDNEALLAVDLTNFNMDFKIENIQADEQYYYVTYSFLDLVLADSAWQYQLTQTTRKISKKIKEDLGEYLAKYLAKHLEARLRELKNEKNLAQAQGEQKRVEVTEYSGLIGKTLDLAAKVFPGYEPAVKRELPSPELIIPPTPFIKGAESKVDNLAQIYNDYVAAHPDLFIETATSSPDTETETAETAASSTPQLAPETAPAETTLIQEPAEVQIIELPEALTPNPSPSPGVTGEGSLPADEASPAETAPVD